MVLEMTSTPLASSRPEPNSIPRNVSTPSWSSESMLASAIVVREAELKRVGVLLGSVALDESEGIPKRFRCRRSVFAIPLAFAFFRGCHRARA